ncbi:MAG: hypothetical protein OXU45_08465 [Candidatus Melainabacteria bacterium]|nr:hypothetical protein [Candidatus Melainabacteria bacterium]
MKKLLLSLFLLALNPAWAEEKKYRTITRTAVGQIRVERRGTKIPDEVTKPPPCNPPDQVYRLTNGCPCNDPHCNSGGGGGGGGTEVEPVEVEQLRMIISAIPAAKFHKQDRLGIYYNPNRKISSENPVRIYNIKTGGYFSAYFDTQGFLHTSVGTVPNIVNGLKPVPSGQAVNLDKLDFQNSAQLDIIYDKPDHSHYKITKTDEIEMDMLPRFRKRYGTITRTTLINGIYMPKGSILIGTRYDGVARPDLNDLKDLRVYSPEGVLINIIPEKDFKSMDCGTVTKRQCFDFESHYTPQQTYDFGARVFAEYNTRSFFPGKSAQQANSTWLEIQRDLESNTMLNINSAKEPWHERILKTLNKEEEVYLKNLYDNARGIDIMTKVFNYKPTAKFLAFTAKLPAKSKVDAFREYCNGTDLSTTVDDSRDEALDKTYDDMNCKLDQFGLAKKNKWDTQKTGDKSEIAESIKKQNKAHQNYDKARQTYNQELKYGAEKRKDSGGTSAEDPGDDKPTVVDPDIPAECQKKKNRDKPQCRIYYEAPPRCINKKGERKSGKECRGYKMPAKDGDNSEQRTVKPAPKKPEPKVKPAPKPKPEPKKPKPKKPKAQPKKPKPKKPKAQPKKPKPKPKPKPKAPKKNGNKKKKK